MAQEKSSHRPYTNAADFVRSLAPNCYGRSVMNRTQASIIWHELAKIWGVDEVEAAHKLVDAYQHLLEDK